jgi:phage-related protein
MYYIATDAVVILDVFNKQTAATPKAVIAACRRRLAEYTRLAATKREQNRAKR